MKLPFFHIMTHSKYKQQLEASYKEGYKTAWSCCYTGQYQRMTDDEKELRILYLSRQNEILKDRQYYFGDASDLWRIFYSEKAPCSKCDYRYSCASNHRACTDLDHYLRTGELRETVREPTPECYGVIIDLKSYEIQK